MVSEEKEDDVLRNVALRNSVSVLAARQRAERDLLDAKTALEEKSRELVQSLALMKATLECTKDAILATDSRGKITANNRRYLEIWNLSESQISELDHHKVVKIVALQFANPKWFVERIEEIYSSQKESHDILHTLNKRVIERSSRIQTIEGQNIGIVWTFSDITDRVLTESKLKEESAILDLLNQTGAQFASTLDLQNLVQKVTDAATQLVSAKFGAFFYNVRNESGELLTLYTLSGAPREAFEKFGHPRKTQVFGPTFDGAGIVRSPDITKDPRYGKMAPHHGMPKGHLPVRSYLAVPVKLASGEVLGGLFFGHPDADVFTEKSEKIVLGIAAQAAIAIDNARLYGNAMELSRQKESLFVAERQARLNAEHISNLKDEFLATLSHELRTPLNSILGWSQLLTTPNMEKDLLVNGLNTIARNAKMQSQLIEDLLDISRITQGKVRLAVETIDLKNTINAALESISPSAAAKNILIEKNFDGNSCCVLADPSRLLQIFWNLLSNAVKFTPKNGKIAVNVKRENSQFDIRISDSGVGIHSNFLPYVFDRFRQEDSTTTRKEGGLGLGLSIVRQLVEMHGGTVKAESFGAGKGSTFTVLLPISAIGTPVEMRNRNVEAGPLSEFVLADFSSQTILVIDDERDSRDIVMQTLKICKANVLVAGSAKQARTILTNQVPDLIISDIGMPEEDGYSFIKSLRLDVNCKSQHVPAIALTAFARDEDRVRAINAGFQKFLSKPVEPTVLVALVKSFFNL